MKDNKDKDEVFSEISSDVRKKLEDRLGSLPDDLLIEFGGGPHSLEEITDGKIKTDWPDSFDRNTWYKTWAKSGAATSTPSDLIKLREQLRQRNIK